MDFSKEALAALRESVRSYMSSERYAHTLGVEKTASELCKVLLGDNDGEIRCAALLHDIAKDTPNDMLVTALNSCPDIDEEDYETTAAYHAFAAPYFVKRDFPAFASKNVISAIFNHTTGYADMSIFDEIIFLSDYIEPGRKYESCINCRDALYSELSAAKDREGRLTALHRATARALRDTINKLSEWGKKINNRTVLAYEFYAGTITE